MSKFKIGDIVKIDDMSKVYHGCVGNVVAVVETGSSAGPIYEIGGVEGYTVPITVSEKDLVLVSYGYVPLKKQLAEYAQKTLYSAIGENEGHGDILVPKIKNVILNDPAVIVMWEDGTKTVVKAQGGEVRSRKRSRHGYLQEGIRQQALLLRSVPQEYSGAQEERS